MTDLFIKPVPLPLPRPIMEEVVTGCSIDCRMPLQASRELTDAFSEGGWYHPSSEGVKPLSELLIGFKRHIDILGNEVAKLGDKWMDLLSQLNTSGQLSQSQIEAITREDLLFTGIGIFLLGCVFVVGYHVIAGLISLVCGNKDK